MSLSEIADNSAISMQLGYGLIQLVDDENDGPLIARITGVRKQISKDLVMNLNLMDLHNKKDLNISIQ